VNTKNCTFSDIFSSPRRIFSIFWGEPPGGYDYDLAPGSNLRRFPDLLRCYTKAHKNLSSRGKKKNLKNSNGPEKSAHVLRLCTFLGEVGGKEEIGY
jgi:hypothetical protein